MVVYSSQDPFQFPTWPTTGIEYASVWKVQRLILKGRVDIPRELQDFVNLYCLSILLIKAGINQKM